MAKKPRTPAPPRPVQAPKRREEPKRRVPARPTVGGPGAGIPRFWLIAGGAVALIAVIVVVAVIALGSKNGSSSVKPVDWATVPGLMTTAPPWPNNNATLPGRLAPLGLTQLGQEGGFVLHHHAYMALFVNDQRVTVPTNIGIYANEWLTELHTHIQEPNLIHIESTRHRSFSLAEFFGVWGLKLTQDCVGRYCGAGKVHWWVNGQPQIGDPGQLTLKNHQVIVIAFGKRPAKILSTYNFGQFGL